MKKYKCGRQYTFNLINTKKKPRDMTLEMQVLALNMHKDVAVLNWLMGSQPSIQIKTK